MLQLQNSRVGGKLPRVDPTTDRIGASHSVHRICYELLTGNYGSITVSAYYPVDDDWITAPATEPNGERFLHKQNHEDRSC